MGCPRTHSATYNSDACREYADRSLHTVPPAGSPIAKPVSQTGTFRGTDTKRQGKGRCWRGRTSIPGGVGFCVEVQNLCDRRAHACLRHSFLTPHTRCGARGAPGPGSQRQIVLLRTARRHPEGYTRAEGRRRRRALHPLRRKKNMMTSYVIVLLQPLGKGRNGS
jgi:hypothetical protein